MRYNRIYLADIFDFLNSLDDSSADLVIADPPYNMAKADWDKYQSEKEYFNFMFQWIDALLPKCKTTASLYFFNNAYNSAILLYHLRQRELILRNWITWYKKDGFSSTRKRYVNTQETILFYTMSDKYTFNFDDVRIPYISTERMVHAAKKGLLKNGKRWFPNEKGKLCNDVWEIASQRHKVKVDGKVQKPPHPTIKPDEMIERMICASSNEGDLVLDLFSGSGTTSKIAKNTNRQFIGCEANEEYIRILTNNGLTYDKL